MTTNDPAQDRYRDLDPEERAQEMCRLRGQGASLQAIADAFDLTRERVRQIIRDAGGPDRDAAIDARREKSARDMAALRERVLRLCREHPGLSAEDAARQLGVTVAQVRRALGPDARRILVASHPSQSQFSDEDVIEHVRRAAAIAGQPLTVRMYEDVRFRFAGASAPLVLQRFGTWRRACTLAGVRHGRPVRSNYQRRWTRGQLVTWVAQYLAEKDSRGSFSDYERWARRTDGAPSGQTIRTQVGPWSAAKAEGLAELMERGDGAFGGPDGEAGTAGGLRDWSPSAAQGNGPDGHRPDAAAGRPPDGQVHRSDGAALWQGPDAQRGRNASDEAVEGLGPAVDGAP